MAKKITFEFGVMSNRYRLQAENKLTAYATMVLFYSDNPRLVAIYEPQDLVKRDSWLFSNPVETRLDEIFGGKGAFFEFMDKHIQEIKEAFQTIEKII
jgi:hypothetical protein